MKERNCLVAIGQNGYGHIVWWGDDPVIKSEVDAMSASLDDLNIGLHGSEEPGLYRWTGTIELDGPADDPDSEMDWNGKLERIQRFDHL